MNDELKNWIVAEYKKGMLEGIKLGHRNMRERIVNLIEEITFSEPSLQTEGAAIPVALLLMLIKDIKD
jgi:hypothetical protein